MCSVLDQVPSPLHPESPERTGDTAAVAFLRRATSQQALADKWHARRVRSSFCQDSCSCTEHMISEWFAHSHLSKDEDFDGRETDSRGDRRH